MSEHDDRRIKDLVDRLVAMSPEPPPYPEEVTVTQRRGSKPRPVLLFAGAAVVVLLLAAVPILLFGGGSPIEPATTTSTVPATDSTSQPSTTTTEPTTQTTAAVTARGAVIYLAQSPENSLTGNPALVPFRTVVGMPESASDVETSVLVLTHPDLIVPDGFDSYMPEGIELLGIEVLPEEHRVVLDMNQSFLGGAGGLLADFTMLNQLIYTATQFGEIESVLFTVEGEPVTAFGSEGLGLTDPVARDSFLDQLNSVLITAPVNGDGTESSLMVQGVANVFEATVSLEVLDSEGEVVIEDFATASCGTGCWGSYEFETDYEFTGEETVRVFYHSPEDGEPADVVTVPVLWDDENGWDLLP